MSEISRTQRWLDLIAYLVGRRFPVAVEELMEKVPAYAAKWVEGSETDRASVRRAFERDKDALRSLGIPLETATWRDSWGEEHHGYTLSRRDFYLPYLKLVERSAGEAAGGAAGTAADEVEPPAPHLAEFGAADPPASETASLSVTPQESVHIGTGLPDVELTPEEAGTALDALRRAAALPLFPLEREARSGFRKLAFDLDPERFAATPVLFVPDPAEEGRGEDLRTLNEALLARKRVAFTYHGIYRDETTERDVAPYGLAFHSGHWYLIGHDALRDDVRVFRLSRMEELRPNTAAPGTPDFEVPEDFRISDHLTREAWELGSADEAPVEARVLFRFPRSLWAERNAKGEAVERRPGGATVRSFQVRQVDPFLRWVLSLEGDAEILEPLELRAALRERARQVLALYASEGGSEPGADPDASEAGSPDDDGAGDA